MNLFRDALGTLRQTFWPLVAFEVLFRLLSVIVLTPVAALVLYWLIATSGSPAVANEDIISFLFSPMGLLTLAGVGTFFFTLVFLEQAGLLLLVSQSVQGQRVTFLGALLRTGRISPRLVGLGLLQFAGYVVAALPFGVAAWLVYRWLLGEHDINYYLMAWPTEFWAALGIGALLSLGLAVIVLLLFVRWLYSLPLVLLRRQGVYQSMRQSAQLARQCFWPAATPLALWLGAMLAAASVGGLILALCSDIAIDEVANHPRWIVPVMTVLIALHLAAGLGWSFFLFIGTSLLVLGLYSRACERLNLPAAENLKPMPDRALSPGERWSLRGVIWAAAAVLLGLAVTSAFAVVESADLPDTVQITAHRGGASAAPENTLAAFRHAMETGADFAELDVQETADGVVVVLHDADVMRMAGVKKAIWEVTYAELQSFDAGKFTPEFRGERFPTLEQVIDLVSGHMKLNIELKYSGHDQQLARRVVDLIDRKHFEDQCVITSLKYKPLLEVKRLNPRLKTGLIVAKSVGKLQKLDVDFFSVNAGLVDRKLVQRVHAAGKQIHVWTINTTEKMQEMMELGVDNLITDYPEKAREFVAQWQGLSNTERVLLALHERLRER